MCSKRLEPFAESLQDLNEKRARNISLLRTQNDSRELRKQYEEEYRHHFLELIISVLTELQFPPTQEAFANPLQNLREDVEFKHRAMLYMLQNVADQSLSRALEVRGREDTKATPRRSGGSTASCQVSNSSINTSRGEASAADTTDASWKQTGTPRSSRRSVGVQGDGGRFASREAGRSVTSPPSSSSQRCPSGLQERSPSSQTQGGGQGACTSDDFDSLCRSLEVSPDVTSRDPVLVLTLLWRPGDAAPQRAAQ